MKALIRCGLILAALSGLEASPPVWGQDAPSTSPVERLNRMSPDYRKTLLENLDKFESLPSEEKASIRNLDTKLSEAAPETRARYQALLRRYHAFRMNLPEATRKELDAETDPVRKLAKIESLRNTEKAKALANPMPFENAFQISELSRVRLRAIARELVVWFSLDPKEDAREKSEFGRLRDPAAIRAYAQDLVVKKNLKGRIRAEEDEFREAENEVRRALPKLLTEQMKAEAQRRLQNRGGGAQAKEAESGEVSRRVAVGKLDEIQVFRNLEREPVDPRNLERFEAALPGWARETLDPLPPDAAKRRLRVLYRLVFPTGTEIPAKLSPEPRKAVTGSGAKRPNRAKPAF